MAGKEKVSQSDVPSYSLEQALEVPKAIADNFAYGPTKPAQVAEAMGVKPNSGPFRGKCGAALAYGLTDGGPNAPKVSIEDLGMRIVRPTVEGDDEEAKREALLTPSIVGEFLRKYNNAQLPKKNIANNVLIDMGVPPDRAESALTLILNGAEAVGFIEESNGKRYVNLSASRTSNEDIEGSNDEIDESGESGKRVEESEFSEPQRSQNEPDISAESPASNMLNERRVFISHGKNKDLVDSIKKLLSFGELEPVVSVERSSVSQPVPDKVMSEMRSCGASIIHVSDEQKLIDQEAKEHIVLNPNVLMEIGAAMALYGRRFILLVKDGVKLPSNLQGLYEVRYSGDNLDGEATIKLLEAIRDVKNYPLPSRYSAQDTDQ